MSCRKVGEGYKKELERLLLSVKEAQNLDLRKTRIKKKKSIKMMPCHLYIM